MSYTKRHYEKYFAQLDRDIELFYQNLYEQGEKPKHTDEPHQEEPNEDYYRELQETRFVEDLNDYWENRHTLWQE